MEGVAPMSKTTRWPTQDDFTVDGMAIASPSEEEKGDEDEDEDEDEDDGGLLSSRTMLVPMPAFDHAETVLQCVDDDIVATT